MTLLSELPARGPHTERGNNHVRIHNFKYLWRLFFGGFIYYVSLFMRLNKAFYGFQFTENEKTSSYIDLWGRRRDELKKLYDAFIIRSYLFLVLKFHSGNIFFKSIFRQGSPPEKMMMTMNKFKKIMTQSMVFVSLILSSFLSANLFFHIFYVLFWYVEEQIGITFFIKFRMWLST